MQTVDALYQREVCIASFEQYLPQADLPLTEKPLKLRRILKKYLNNQLTTLFITQQLNSPTLI